MLTSWVVVGLSIQIQVGVGGLPVHIVTQGAIWSSVYVHVHEGKVVIQLLHGELDIGTNVVEAVNKITQLFWSMRPDYECSINITEPTSMLVAYPAEHHLFKVLHEDNGSYM